MVDWQGAGAGGAPPTLGDLFHRLNNQLSVILAHAELLEAKAPDEQQRQRASQVVTGALGAMETTRALRSHVEGPP